MITQEELAEILKVRSDGRLHHREGQRLEFKEQFNFAGLADYFRDFSAFANNKGGLLVFGVLDNPRTLKGLTAKSIEQFEAIDPEKITNYLLEIFSGHVEWEQALLEHEKMKFGAFQVSPAQVKPIIAKKDEGKDNTIRSGDVYFRYGGRTQRIRFYELNRIIQERIEMNNRDWLARVRDLSAAGPGNAAIVDLEASTIRQGDAQVLVIDEALTSKIKFVQQGRFVESEGAEALKIVGDVRPINRIEVVKRVKENLLKEYPLTSNDLWLEVKKRCPDCKQTAFYRTVAEAGIRSDPAFARFNFRNRRDEQQFEKTGKAKRSTPIIYRPEAAEHIVMLLNQKSD